MKANLRALTMVELLFIVVIVIIVAMMLLPALAKSRELARRPDCGSNLKQLGKAFAAYREDNGGYFPFSWQRAGDPEPVGNGAAQAAMAATSLGNLYPRYVQNAKLFTCPSSEDEPYFAPNLPLEFRDMNPPATSYRNLPAGSNWTLTQTIPEYFPAYFPAYYRRASSYGYDPRMSPRAWPNLWVAADMDGYWGNDRSSMNHDGAQNVLFADGHVKWTGISNSGSHYHDPPMEKEFLEHNWDADTDTYLLSKDAGLEISFDEYKHLHYPQKK